MTFDNDQLAAVAALNNTVVSAGAGSGKTTVLAERYLRLVRDLKTPVDQILTLTFTRKAAAEMHERIYRRLSGIADDPFVATQLERFDRAPISTLDSFCSQLVRASAPRFGVTPEFRTDEDEHRRLAEDVALEVLLDHIAGEAVGRFVAANSFDAVWNDCLVAIAEHYCVITRPIDASDIATRQHDTLARAIDGELEKLLDAVAVIQSLTLSGKGKNFANAQAAASMLGEIDLECHHGGLDPDLFQSKLERITGVRKPAGAVSDPDLLAFKEELDTLRTVAHELLSLIHGILCGAYVRELLDMVAEFDRRLQADKRSRGVLTYNDVMEMAIATLREDPELRQYYNRRFRFIMIDEFQDNNDRQKLLLYLLSLSDEALGPDGMDPLVGDPTGQDLHPQKLFFVGDDKQSIYRFRGADVSVFRSLSGELAGDGAEPIVLAHNYRSQPPLIDFFNQLFPKVMANAVQPFEAAFSPLVPGAHPTIDSTVTLLFKPHDPVPGDEEEETLRNEDVEAFRVAEWIAHAVEQRTLPVHTSAGVRPAGYDDIALLLRSTGNQMRFERMFRRFGIPYQSQTARSLFLEVPAWDLYQLLQLACFPGDRQAYAAFLRSPLVHLDDDAMVEVMLSRTAPFAESGLTGEQLARYQAGGELYADIVGLIDRVASSSLVSRIWHRWGYRYSLLRSSSAHPYLEYYEHLFAFVRRWDDRPIVELLDAWRKHLGNIGRLPDMDVIQEYESGVQIMTVHRSKGLEFPVVILANTGNSGRQEGTGTAPFHVSQKHGLTFNLPQGPVSGKPKLNWFFSQGKAEEAEKELAEAKRVLYVALTRAESHLVISGYHHSGNRNREQVHLNMVLAALGIPPGLPEDTVTPGGRPHPAVELRFLSDIPQSEMERHRARGLSVDVELAARRYAVLPQVARSVARREYSSTELNTMMPDSGAVGQVLAEIDSDALIPELKLEQAFGTLCHTAIEMTVLSGHPPSATELERRAPAAILSEVPARSLAMVLSDALALADRFFVSPQYKSRISPAAVRGTLEVEYPFLLRPRGAEHLLVRGQIDLLAPLEPSGGVIVDFKTNRCMIPDEYRIQLALYRQAALAILGEPVTAWVCYLRDGLWVDYSDAAADIPALLDAQEPVPSSG